MHDRDAVRVDDLAGHRQARAESRQQIPQPRAAPGLMQLTPLAIAEAGERGVGHRGDQSGGTQASELSVSASSAVSVTCRTPNGKVDYPAAEGLPASSSR
jgi:hypothetical protein